MLGTLKPDTLSSYAPNDQNAREPNSAGRMVFVGVHDGPVVNIAAASCDANAGPSFTRA